MKQIAKNSTEYWARRKAEFVVSQLDKAENTAEIMKQTYAKAQKHLVDQADKIFLKYQRDYKLSETQARAILKRSGVDVMKLKRELQNGVQSDEIKQILTDMDSAAYASRIEKLIQSQKDIDSLMLGMSKNDNKLLTNHLKNIADDSYLHEMFMLQKRAKVAFEFGSLDPAYVDKLLHVNWSGKHFSQAIWNNHAELGQTLKEEYLVNYLTGRSSFDMAKVIEYRFGVEGYKARRIVRTESTFFSAELEAKAYEEAGIEQYEYVSVLDDRTTHVCKSKDGKIYNVKDRRAGVNYPPLHVFCRATTIAHIPDEWLEEKDGDVFDDKILYKDFKKGLPNNHQLMYNLSMEKRREIDHNKMSVASKQQINKMSRKFRRRGGKLISDKEAIAYLNERNAEAVTLDAYTIIIREKISISTLIEELEHTEQYLRGDNDGSELAIILNEIAAKEKSISEYERYKLPKIEINSVKKEIKRYKKELRRLQNDN